MTEEWKDIKDYEGLYQISNLGNIKSLIKNKILKPYINKKNGYSYIGLHKNKKIEVIRIHKLVATHFIPNLNNFPVINHKNGIRNDNRVDNLEWCTQKYNITYSLGKKISQYNINNNFIKEWNSAMEIERNLKISNSNINKCCQNKRKTAGGYIWKYSN